ncbi:MAG: flagellar hook assembly protein FlgD [Armatimonadota bacterium]
MVESINLTNKPPAAEKSTNLASTDAFLKLFTTQLRYQDPLQPMTSPEFLAQTAQFQTLQRLQDVGKQLADLANYVRILMASSLIGKTVQISPQDGETKSVAVSGIRVSPAGIFVVSGNAEFPIDTIKAIV